MHRLFVAYVGRHHERLAVTLARNVLERRLAARREHQPRTFPREPEGGGTTDPTRSTRDDHHGVAQLSRHQTTEKRRPNRLSVAGSGGPSTELPCNSRPSSSSASSMLVTNRTTLRPGHIAGPALKGTNAGCLPPSSHSSGTNESAPS